MDNQSRSYRRDAGSALIAILWIVAILSIAVFSSTQWLFVELESDSNDSALMHAELLADKGIAIASHKDVLKGDPVLQQTINESEGFEAQIGSAGDRLAINTLLQENESGRRVLELLFVSWGLRTDEATDVVDNLIDWVDADDLPTMVGAEKSYYVSQNRPAYPFNRPFKSLSEVTLVKDFDNVTERNGNWRNAFTLLSSGKLDLNEAPPELIAAACECSIETAQAFTDARSGFDGIAGTEDDIVFENLSEALFQLGVSAENQSILDQRLGVNDPIQRIISVGRYGGLAVERSVSIQYTGERGKILEWTSRRIE